MMTAILNIAEENLKLLRLKQRTISTSAQMRHDSSRFSRAAKGVKDDGGNS
jgi:hypothetical protein